MRKSSKYVLVLFVAIVFFSIAGLMFAVNGFHAVTTPVIDTISIATFNIQTFGQSKLNKTDVMERIVDIIGRYDVVAIQEIRSKEQNMMPRLIDMLNKSGKKYDYIISRRLGRTNSKEQYAFVYNSKNISYVNDSAFVVGDKDDLLHREPLVADFQVRNGTFDFTLINIHTDPDETKQELNYLDDVYRAVQEADPYENDVILLGDFNEPGDNLYELGNMHDMIIALSDRSIKTNTRNTMQYDNILFDKNTAEYTGEFGIFDYENEFGISKDEALMISDHRPVAAKFAIDGND
ncbi:endonuclease/exonuclease/phosphatase family protein [Candidatus Woesearchaeota archaeon]|nr:endonuclease/exonuclease/phosphatase family protein [Candidatus Woesearchaeota archaeon]